MSSSWRWVSLSGQVRDMPKRLHVFPLDAWQSLRVRSRRTAGRSTNLKTTLADGGNGWRSALRAMAKRLLRWLRRLIERNYGDN